MLTVFVLYIARAYDVKLSVLTRVPNNASDIRWLPLTCGQFSIAPWSSSSWRRGQDPELAVFTVLAVNSKDPVNLLQAVLTVVFTWAVWVLWGVHPSSVTSKPALSDDRHVERSD
jgi:hypothetical protein